MTVLVAYASAHGTTREISERVGARLRELGYEAEVLAVDEVGDVRAYEAAVVGSAIQGQSWLPTALDFVRDKQTALTEKPLWLFSVGLPTAFKGLMGKLLSNEHPKVIAKLPPSLRSHEHQLFNGAIRSGNLPAVGRVILLLLGGRFGDFRDWPAIDAWTNRVAKELAEWRSQADRSRR